MGIRLEGGASRALLGAATPVGPEVCTLDVRESVSPGTQHRHTAAGPHGSQAHRTAPLSAAPPATSGGSTERPAASAPLPRSFCRCRGRRGAEPGRRSGRRPAQPTGRARRGSSAQVRGRRPLPHGRYHGAGGTRKAGGPPQSYTSGSPREALRAGAGLCGGEGRGRGSLGLGPPQGPTGPMTKGRGVTQSSSSPPAAAELGCHFPGAERHALSSDPQSRPGSELRMERGEKGTVLWTGTEQRRAQG